VSQLPLPGLPVDAALASSRRAARGPGQFVWGPENRLLGQILGDLLRAPLPGPTPIVLHGPPGTGKSHLAWGLATVWLTRLTAGEVCHESGADFSARYAAAIRQGRLARFRARYATTLWWVCEDLELLSDRPGAQVELTNLLDELLARGGQFVATSKLPPGGLEKLDIRLRSRLSGGLAVPVAEPALETRQALLESFAHERGCPLPPGAAEALAQAVDLTIRDLLGAVLQLHTQSQLDGRLLNAADARDWLARRPALARPTLARIAQETARYFQLKVADLKSASRKQAIVNARGVAIWLARELTDLSLAQIGRYLGGRDHATILHALRKTQALSAADPLTAQALARIKERLPPS